MKKLHTRAIANGRSNPFQQKYQKKCLKMLFFVYFTMQHIQGISRNQLQMGSLEDKIVADKINIQSREEP